jgi:hypothetical protein
MLDRHLAGDDGRSTLVAIVDDFEEIAALLASKRGKAPIMRVSRDREHGFHRIVSNDFRAS